MDALKTVTLPPDDSAWDLGPGRFAETPARFYGGQAEVIRVQDRVLERDVAKKTVHPRYRNQDAMERALRREAVITGQLVHPGILPIFDVGIDPESGPFFTMPFVQGPTLRDRLAEELERPMAPNRLFDLLEVVLRVADVLRYAHARGVVHCDVKPANVLLGRFGELFLLDWGSAFVPSLEPPRTHIYGSPCYMAPEQAQPTRAGLGPWTDVFALGALLHEIVTGVAPRQGTNVVEIVTRASLEPLAALPQWAPPRLRSVVERATALEPAERYPDVDSLQEDLRRLLRSSWAFPIRRYAPGDTIVRLGDPGGEAFFLLSGRCAVTDPSGELSRVLMPGEIFGELSLLRQKPRSRTVFALEASTCQVIDRSIFDRDMQDLNPWMFRMLRNLADRVP